MWSSRLCESEISIAALTRRRSDDGATSRPAKYTGWSSSVAWDLFLSNGPCEERVTQTNACLNVASIPCLLRTPPMSYSRETVRPTQSDQPLQGHETFSTPPREEQGWYGRLQAFLRARVAKQSFERWLIVCKQVYFWNHPATVAHSLRTD